MRDRYCYYCPFVSKYHDGILSDWCKLQPQSDECNKKREKINFRFKREYIQYKRFLFWRYIWFNNGYITDTKFKRMNREDVQKRRFHFDKSEYDPCYKYIRYSNRVLFKIIGTWVVIIAFIFSHIVYVIRFYVTPRL